MKRRLSLWQWPTRAVASAWAERGLRPVWALCLLLGLSVMPWNNTLQAQNNWEVTVSSPSWGDGTTWSLVNSSSVTLLSGGTYGNGYSDTQNVTVAPGDEPLTFTISSTLGDNSPNYTLSCNGVVLSGNLPGGASQSFPGLFCNAPASLCDGTFTAGSITANTTSACVGANVALVLTSANNVGGLSFQWQTSPDNVSWSDAVGAPNADSWSFSFSGAQWYRVETTCTEPGGGVDVSDPIFIDANPFFNCYCTDGVGPTSPSFGQKYAVRLEGTGQDIDNTLAAPCPAQIQPNGVYDFTSLSANLVPGQSYTIEVDMGQCGTISSFNNIIKAWIDWNQDGVFDETTEELGFDGPLLTPGEPSTILGTITFTVPVTATSGTTGLRVMQRETTNEALLTPCESYLWGSVHDYAVNIIQLNCDLPEATAEVIEDCGSSQFTIEVDLTFIGSASQVNIIPSIGSPIAATTEDLYILGPYTSGSSVSVSVQNDDDNLCTINLGSFGDCCSSTALTIDNTLPTGNGNFESFTDAINFLNAGGDCGPVAYTFTVTSGQVFDETPPAITRSGDEFNPIIFQTDGNGPNPVITPTGSTALNDAGIVIRGAHWITFDGIDIDGNAAGNVQFGYLITNASATQGASNNTIRNASITLDRSVTNSRGVYVATTTTQSTGFTPSSLDGTNNNNLLENLTITNSYYGIYVHSGSTTWPGTGNAVIGCTIGADYVGIPDSDIGGGTLFAAGIYFNAQEDIEIAHNVVRNIGSSGINRGIYTLNARGDCDIHTNQVYGIRNTSPTGTSGQRGIELGTATAGTTLLRVYNNMVSDITAAYTGGATATRVLQGIYIANGGTTRTYEIDFNSVNIDGSGSINVSSVCFETISVVSPIRLRSNSFVNATAAQTGTAKHFAVRTSATNSIGAAGSEWNWNNYYLATTASDNGFIGITGTTDRATLQNWSDAITVYPGTDANSLGFPVQGSDPFYVDAQKDLHGTGPDLVGAAIPGGLAWVSVDFDGEARLDPSTIGADEYVPATCFPPSGLVITDLQPTSIDFEWDDNGSVSYDWEVRTSGAAGSGPAGLVDSGNTTGTTASVGGLDDETTYAVYVRSDCGSSVISAWTSGVFASTPCSAISTLPWMDDFESYPFPTTLVAQPEWGCYTLETIAGTAWRGIDGLVQSQTAFSGTKMIYGQWSTANAWVFTPGIELEAGESYDFSFMYKVSLTSTVPMSFNVAVGTQPNDASMGQLGSTVDYNSLDWENHLASFTPPASGVYYFGVQNVTASATPWRILLDDFMVQETPACAPPTGLSSVGASLSEANHSWNASITDPVGYEWAVTSSPTPPSSGTFTTETTASSSGLLPNVPYYLHVRSDCDNDGLSTWVTSVFEIGYCEPIYTTGKTSGDLISNVEIPGTTLANNSGTDPVNPAYTYFTGQPNYTADLQAGTTYNISVTYGSFASQQCAVWIDFNGDGVFETPSERVGFTTSNSVGSFATVSFPITLPCDPVPGTYRMRVRNVYATAGNTIDPCATYTWGETEDYDVTILPPPPCVQPNNFISSVAGQVSVVLNWNQGCTETEWEVEYGATGFTPGTGTTVVANTNVDFLLTGLDENTEYDVYVRSDCGPDGLSPNTGPLAVQTAPGCGQMFYDTGGEFGDYDNNEDYVITFCPDNPTGLVELIFELFHTETNWDGLFVFDGPDTSSPLIPGTNPGNGTGFGPIADYVTQYGGIPFWGNGFSGALDPLPAPIISTHPSGCLTVQFVSDASGVYPGWELEINCVECGCPLPEFIVTEVTDNSITIDVDYNGVCAFDIADYDTFDLEWSFGGSATGVSMPYTITGLDPATLYIIDATAACDTLTSPSSGVAQITLNCEPDDLCTYELTLSNSSGNGFNDAFIRVNNGWTQIDYTLSEDQSTNTWTILACPNNPLSVEMINNGNGSLANNYSVTLVNSDDVTVYQESGPDETLLYFITNGCPDCFAVSNVMFTRLASDLVEVTWNNIALSANVDDIEVVVFIEDDLTGDEVIIGSETYPAGTTSASVVLDGEYAAELVTVDIITNCSNGGIANAQNLVELPECAAADQCEYVFDMTSNDNGWGDYGLNVLLDGGSNFLVSLPTGTAGTQSVFACSNGTIDVSSITSGASSCEIAVTMSSASWGDGTTWALTDNDGATVLSGGPYGNGYTDTQTLSNADNGPYSLSITSTLGDNSPNYSVEINGDVAFAGTGAPAQTTVVGPISCSAGGAACDDVSFSLTLNPNIENATLIPNTNFCGFEDSDLLYSGTTCPSCFAPFGVSVANITLTSAEVSWNSNNEAGTEATVYIGVPGFTPGVDDLDNEVVVTTGTNPEGPVNFIGLSPDTQYEVLIVEDCDGEDSDFSPSFLFTTEALVGICDLTFEISSASWGDGTTWTVTDNDGNTVLTGGPYGNGYSDIQTLPNANNGPYTWNIVSTLGDNSPNYTVSTGGDVLFTGNVPGGSSASVGPISCPPPPTCEYTVNVFSAEWGDGTTWTLTDNDGNTVLSGGPYGNGYADSQTLSDAFNAPYTLTIISTLGDNSPNYEVLVDGNLEWSGNVPGATTGTVNNITCAGDVPPPPTGCDLTFEISSASWGDGTTWTVTDNDGNTVLTGGPYGNGYSDIQTLPNASNGPYTWNIVSTMGDNSPNYTVSAGTEVLFTGNVPGATTANVGPITCPAPPTCEIEVSMSSGSWGDGTTWTLTDNDGNTVLSGGPYGNGYSDVQTLPVADNGPYTLTIVSTMGDNSPEYSVSVDGIEILSGTATPSSVTTLSDISCSAVPPCDVTVDMSSPSWGDGTTWTLDDTDGVTVLSGGPYGNGFTDSQTLPGASNGPYTLTIVSTMGDNSPDYSVSVGGTVVFSGTAAAAQTTVIEPIAPECFVAPGPCDAATPIACGDVISGSTVGAPTDPVDFCGTANGTGGKAWYEFIGSGEVVTATTCDAGTGFDTKMWVFTGDCNNLTCVAGNDDMGAACSFGGLLSEVEFVTTAGETYYIVVGGFGPAEGNYELSVTCAPVPTLPECTGPITAIPNASCSVTTVQFTWDAVVDADGYNIYAGDIASGNYNLTPAPVFNALPEIFLNNPTPNTTFYILVVPTNIAGEAIGCIEISYTTPDVCPPPPNDLCGDAIMVSCGSVTAGTTAAGSLTDAPAFCGTGVNTSAGVWYTVQGIDGLMSATTCSPNSNFDTKLAVYSGSCGSLSCVGGNDDAACSFSGLLSTVNWVGSSSDTYYIYVTGFGASFGNFELTIDCVPYPANNECGSAQNLSVAEYPATNNTLGNYYIATNNGGPACTGSALGGDVFYTFTAPFANHYWVNVNPFGGADLAIEVTDACGGTVVACENSNPAGVAESVFIQNLPAGTYTVRVYSSTAAPTVAAANFLINVQSFPIAQVQSNPANFLFACNQTGVQLEDLIGASPQTGQLSGILDYQWWIAEEEGTFQNSWIRGAPNYSTKPTWLGMQYAGITYNVFVRILLNVPGEGPVWGVYPQFNPDPHAVGASFCTITTSQNVTLTEVHPNYTPTNLSGNAYALCNLAVAKNVADAQDFEWEFADGIDPPVYYQRGAGNPSVKLSWINCLKPNTTYNVRVRAQVNGIWGDFGPTRIIDLAPTAFTQVRPNICNTTRTLNQFLLPTNICIADQFEYELTNTVTSEVHTIISTALAGNGFLNTAVPSLVPGATYSVRVKATQCGVEGDFSVACDVTIAGPQAQGDETPALRDLASNGSSLYPNPNAGSEVRLELHGLGDGAHDVHVVIYDIYGKMISTTNFGHEGTDLSRLIRFDGNLAMGMYMVHVLVDGEQFAVERMVVK